MGITAEKATEARDRLWLAWSPCTLPCPVAPCDSDIGYRSPYLPTNYKLFQSRPMSRELETTWKQQRFRTQTQPQDQTKGDFLRPTVYGLVKSYGRSLLIGWSLKSLPVDIKKYLFKNLKFTSVNYFSDYLPQYIKRGPVSWLISATFKKL